MQQWDFWLNQLFWLNTAIVLTVTLVSYLILRSLIGILSKRLATWAAGRQNKFYGFAVEMLRRTSRFLLFAFSLLLGLKLIELTPKSVSKEQHVLDVQRAITAFLVENFRRDS